MTNRAKGQVMTIHYGYGNRHVSGRSHVTPPLDPDFRHHVLWQAELRTPDKLPVIAVRIDGKVDLTWNVRHILDTEEDLLWECFECGFGKCWHMGVARAAIPEFLRQILGPIHHYRRAESALLDEEDGA